MSRHDGRVRLLILTVMPSPYQRELFDAMAAHPRFDLRVLYCTATSPDRQWAKPSLPPYSRVMSGVALHALTRNCCLNPSVRRELRAWPADLAVVSGYFTLTSQIAMRQLSQENAPWLFWGEWPGMSSPSGWRSLLRRCAQRPIREAHGVVAIGSRAQTAYGQLFGDRMPVFNVPYHCDLDAYLAIRRPAGTGSPVRFLFSGQMIPRKGVDVLLKAFETMSRQADARRSPPTLTLLGDGPYRDTYESAVSADLRSRIVFRGHRNPRDLPAEFAGTDVFVLPSRHDGWGVVVNEAIGAGMPVIATSAVGAAHDLVESGVNGFVVNADDPDSLAAAMLRFVRRPSLVTEFGARSRRIAADWTLARGVERWCEVCDCVLGSVRRPHARAGGEAVPA